MFSHHNWEAEIEGDLDITELKKGKEWIVGVEILSFFFRCVVTDQVSVRSKEYSSNKGGHSAINYGVLPAILSISISGD